MLFLLLKLDSNRLVLSADQVIEVLPLLEVKKVMLAPPAVAGVLDFRGIAVPVIDLCQLLLKRPAQPRLSTRILIVRTQASADEPTCLGLVAEGATETIRRDPKDFSRSAVSLNDAPYLGPVAVDALGLIQRIDVSHLWPEVLRAHDFVQPRIAKWF